MPGDVDFETGVLRVVSKGMKREPMILVPEALEIIGDRIADPAVPVFGVRDSRTFANLIRRTGLNEGVTDRAHRVWFHTFRHTFASWLAQAGVDIYHIQKLMRHASVVMTQRYAHLSPDHQRPHLEVVRRILAACREETPRDGA
jgi:integrase